MLPSSLKLPVGATLCGASLCAAAVLLLQNVSACARWVEEHELASHAQVQASVRLLQRVSATVYLPVLNQAESSLADSASSLLEQSTGEGELLSLQQSLPDAPPPAIPPTEDEECGTACVAHPSAPQVPPTESSEARVSNRENSCAQSTEGSADGEAEPEPESTRESGHDCECTKYSGIFTPSPFLSVPSKFSFSFPRDMFSVGALHWSVADVRAAAPQGTFAKPSESIASKPEVDNDREQPGGSTANADAKPEVSPAAQATLAEGETTPPMRCRLLMVGDSLMETLGPMAHRAMSHRMGLEFIISARYSTGLCRPDYFN